ncbi:MAG: HlyC/CorC family transporter [Methanospirillaceae archaeon]|nr:HlyC/CorC family transporter [Methanospirillaceae archaeon]
MSYVLEMLVILFLIALNGIFAMSEFAIVSAKKMRLVKMEQEGDVRATVALDLAREPTPFLSTIQIGITLVGIFAGAFGGAMLAEQLGVYLNEIFPSVPYSDLLSLALVVLVITYFTLVFGEIVPKRIALQNPERIAVMVAKPLRLLSVIARPLVMILSASTNAILHIARLREDAAPLVTEEDIKILLAEGTKDGIFFQSELSMVTGVFALDDRRVETLMTHRPDIITLDLLDPVNENLQIMIESCHSSFPVYEEHIDNIVGMISIKDVLRTVVQDDRYDLRASLTQPLFIPEGISVLTLLESFKKSGVLIALVTDEYGGIQGIITLHDILEAIVGDVHSPGEPVETPIVRRKDGSWLIDGDVSLEDIHDHIPVNYTPEEGRGHYRTIAGFILYMLQRIPIAGDYFEYEGFRFEVVDMDKKRIDKVMVSRVPDFFQEGSQGKEKEISGEE